MKNHFNIHFLNVLLALLILVNTFTANFKVSNLYQTLSDTEQLYRDCNLQKLLAFKVFSSALCGFKKMNLKNNDIVTIIDFSKPSTIKRFFVIDLKNKELLYSCYVAHGKNSGENYATNFSDKAGSLMSCQGFFITAETYSGKHGYSLKLDGVEVGINGNARKREIVIHGADYVSDDFIKAHGRLGRSWGCPALPVDLTKEIIDIIKGGTGLFIYTNDLFYYKISEFATE